MGRNLPEARGRGCMSALARGGLAHAGPGDGEGWVHARERPSELENQNGIGIFPSDSHLPESFGQFGFLYNNKSSWDRFNTNCRFSGLDSPVLKCDTDSPFL